MNLKQLWEKLARENSRYYINSDKGRGITEEEFNQSGIEDYNRLILNDPLLPKGGTFLEIGCGTGRMTQFIRLGYTMVYGTDISGEMIRQGRERLQGMNVILAETDGKTIPIPLSSIDVAFSYLVFQHMKDRNMVKKNFKEVHRVLKRGGIFKVLLRADPQNTLKPWWAGVDYDEESAKNLYSPLGFHLIKSEKVKTYGLWLWLVK